MSQTALFDTEAPRPPRSAAKLCGLILFGFVLFVGFLALGTWQVYRLDSKLDLIERVNNRVYAEPAAAPGLAQWPGVSEQSDEYRHVRVTGRYLEQGQALVLASTRKGSGYWVMTPLRTRHGFVVLVNRGFVPKGDTGGAGSFAPTPDGPVTVTGLLRMSVPGGMFLRPNDPKQGRWYTRDVAAIAADAGLAADQVAPYFIDADEGTSSGQWPRGGLTVIKFRNAHLVYAITWYALAGLVVIAAFIVTRFELRSRHHYAERGRNN